MTTKLRNRPRAGSKTRGPGTLLSVAIDTCAFTPTAGLLILALGTAACSGTVDAPTADAPPTAPPVTIPPLEILRTLTPGQAFSGTLTGTEPECMFWTVDGGWGGLCHAFAIVAPSSGILAATVRWSQDAPLNVFLKTSDGSELEMGCCGSPVTTHIPVENGARYRLEVAYGGRPAGYPRIAAVNYLLETRLLSPAEAQAPAPWRAIVLADEARTQRMSRARLEIVGGPFAGAAAAFDSVSGTYDLIGLPWGYADIRASADGFEPLIVHVPVGVSVAREIVLSRSVPLPGATHSLGGAAWSANTAYTGVKVEILDGPHAGIFTFTDDLIGGYRFQSLSPGLISVRASRPNLGSQTRSVTVSGATLLHFYW